MLQENQLEVRIVALETLCTKLQERLSAAERRLSANEQQTAQAYTAPYLSSGSGGLQPALLTGALATGSLASPASAGATLYNEAAGSFASGPSINVKNTYTLTASIASGKQVWVKEIGGSYYMVTANC